MKDIITYSTFEKIDIRVGTVIDAVINEELHKPSIILKIDFGNQIGIKKSSAQLTKNYNPKKLIKKQVAAVLNFNPKQIGNLVSEVLVIGFPDDNNEPILVSPERKVSNGVRLY